MVPCTPCVLSELSLVCVLLLTVCHAPVCHVMPRYALSCCLCVMLSDCCAAWLRGWHTLWVCCQLIAPMATIGSPCTGGKAHHRSGCLLRRCKFKRMSYWEGAEALALWYRRDVTGNSRHSRGVTMDHGKGVTNPCHWVWHPSPSDHLCWTMDSLS